MKHKSVFVVVIVLITCVLVIINNYNLRKDIEAFELSLTASSNEMAELRNEFLANNQVKENKLDKSNQQIEIYESLIIKWFDLDIHNNFQVEMIQKSYDVEALVHTEDISFDIPKNGFIQVNTDSLEIEITIGDPPEVPDPFIYERLHYYNKPLESLDFNFIENYSIEGDTLKIIYNDLKDGDVIRIPLSTAIQYLLNLDSKEIIIEVTDAFPLANEYRPINIQSKEFTSFSGGTFIHEFEYLSQNEYLSENEWVLDNSSAQSDYLLAIETNNAYKIKYTSLRAIKIIEYAMTSNVYFDAFSEERIILPEFIQLGYQWMDQGRTVTITGINSLVETPVGSFEAVEVTYSKDDVAEYMCYYAKNIGLIKRVFQHNNDQVLININYLQ